MTRPRDHRRRRGFTLLELVLAASIASLVVAAALGVLTAITRTDRQLSDRATQLSELTILHTVLQRSFSRMVMSSSPMPQRTAPDGSPLPQTELPEARMLLDWDVTGAGRVPRLEVVTLLPIVPAQLSVSQLRNRLIAEQAQIDLEEASVRGLDPAARPSAGRGGSAGVQGVRGVLELRPGRPEDERLAVVDLARGWTLWYRRLDSVSSAASRLPDPGTPIATGITSLKWQAFHKRVRKTEFTATWAQELPAYMELQITTTAGISVNWMFEISWFSGPVLGEREPGGPALPTGEMPDPADLPEIPGAPGVPGGGFTPRPPTAPDPGRPRAVPIGGGS